MSQKQGIIKMAVSLVVATMAFTIHALADPSITTVTGTLMHGSTVMITGSGFGAKNPAKPLAWADFEQGLLELNGQDSTLSANDLALQNITTISPRDASTNDTHSSHHLSYNFATDPGDPFMYVTTTRNTYKDFYLFVRRQWNGPADFWTRSSVGNLKYFRPRPNFNNSMPNLIIAIAGSLKYNMEGVQLLRAANRDSSLPPINTWLREEIVFRHSDVNVANGTVRYWINGILRHNRDGNYLTCDSANAPLRRFAIINNDGTRGFPPADSFVYVDDFYVDTTWSRVMIGDQPTFDNSTHREIEIPTVWSPNSIDIVVNQGTFQDGETVYFYVVYANGSVNANSFPLMVGGPPDTTVPAAPEGLTLQ